MSKISQRHKVRSQGAKPEPLHSRKDLYDLLLRYYTEESDRYEALNKRAAAYLSIVGVVSAFAAFKTEVASYALRSSGITALVICALAALLACVLAIALSMRVTEYKSPVNPRKLVLAAEADAYSSNDTHSVLLAGLVEATEWNRSQNDKRASALQASLWFAALAVVLAIAINVTILFFAQTETRMSNTGQGTNSSAPAPTPSTPKPGSTPIADLLNNTQAVPLKKSTDRSPSTPPSAPKK